MGVSIKSDWTPTDYIDYKEVIFTDNKVDPDLFKDYKITDVRGEIYTITPIKELFKEENK